MPSSYRNNSSKKPKPRSHARPAPSEPKPSQTPSEKTEGYQREFRHPSSREWTRIVSNVIAAHNGICHLPVQSPRGASGRPRYTVRGDSG